MVTFASLPSELLELYPPLASERNDFDEPVPTVMVRPLRPSGRVISVSVTEIVNVTVAV